MNYFKRLLALPLKRTLQIIIVSLVVYLILTVAYIFLIRFSCIPDATSVDQVCQRIPILAIFAESFVNDFRIASRFIFEASVILLAVQLVRRFVNNTKA